MGGGARPDSLTSVGSPGRRELLIAAAVVAVCAAALFGWHVPHGGLYWDDWENAATTAFPPDLFLGPIELRLLVFRPVLALLLPALSGVAGAHPAPQLLIAAALTAAMIWCLYLALRHVGLEAWHAAGVAGLALLFPFSLATRVWPTGAVNNVALMLCLLGLVAGLTALAPGRDPTSARRLRRIAPGLYVLGVLTYEAVALPALLAVLVYAGRAGWRPALRQWRREVPWILATVVLNALATRRKFQDPLAVLEHAGQIAAGAATLMARSLLPGVGAPAALTLSGLALLVAGAAWRRGRRPVDDPGRRHLTRGLELTLAGMIVVAAGYAAFVPSHLLDYNPLDPGVGDRINLVPALGYALTAYGAALLIGSLIGRGRPALATGVTGALAGTVAVAWAVTTIGFERQWQRAGAMQQAVLARVERHAATLPGGSTLYTFGHLRYAAPGVPVFAQPWDLNGAIKVHSGNPSLSAYPLGHGGRLTCAARGVGPAAKYNNVPAPAAYGRAFWLDVRTDAFRAIDSRARCRALNRRMEAT